MDRESQINLVRQTVQEVNDELDRIAVVISGSGAQWQRGNGSIQRADNNDIATLSINLQQKGFPIGCDGVRRGINHFLSENFPLHDKNSQNIRYLVDADSLRRVVLYYANFN